MATIPGATSKVAPTLRSVVVASRGPSGGVAHGGGHVRPPRYAPGERRGSHGFGQRGGPGRAVVGRARGQGHAIRGSGDQVPPPRSRGRQARSPSPGFWLGQIGSE